MKRFLIILLVIGLTISSLALTPAERQIAKRIEDNANKIELQNKQLQDYAGWADQEIKRAWDWGGQVDKNLGVLKSEIDTAHENEKRALADNARMQPVYDAVTRWWDLGAFVWGFQQLLKHLLILTIAASLLTGVLWGLSFLFPVIGGGLKTAWNFVTKLFKNILARFKKKK